jgi:hypothetical protein
MADAANIDKADAAAKALDGISVAQPRDEDTPATPPVREAEDAEHHDALKDDPSHADSKLEIGLDESFPTSDPPATTQPGHSDPAPSSGYDEEAEKALAAEKAA